MNSPVTVLGLGAMGAALAEAFLAAGHPTTVWNRTASRAEPLVAAGAARAETPSEAVLASPLVVVCVRDYAAASDLLAPLVDDLAGRTVVNLTSATPEQAREQAAWAEGAGVRYLDGAILVPTPLVGTPDALVLYSGPRELFDEHRATLAAIGGEADFLGVDEGLAAVYDLAMLDLFFVGMTGFLHAAALAGADGVAAKTFLPYARRITGVLAGTLDGLARDVDAGSYPGDEDTVEMELAAMEHIVHTSKARGVRPELPELVRGLLADAVADGHGKDGFSRVVEALRS